MQAYISDPTVDPLVDLKEVNRTNGEGRIARK